MVNVTFWGVRGSTPCPCEQNMRYGGNTACVTIEAPGIDPIVFDLGTGLRFFGETREATEPFRGLALVTHLHWDHVQGLPFFTPLHREGSSLEVRGRSGCGSLEESFRTFMKPPFFPVGPDDLMGDITFHDMADEEVSWGRAKIIARDVPHTGPTNGYRVEIDGLVIAYVSDHQQPDDATSVADSVIELCRGADLLIHDAQFERHEFAQKADWGHCTVEYAVNVAEQAGARRLALFHHDPSHTDDIVDRLVWDARQAVAAEDLEVFAAGEGVTVALSPAALV